MLRQPADTHTVRNRVVLLLTRTPVVQVAVGSGPVGAGAAPIVVRDVVDSDLTTAEELERSCFAAHCLKRRQLRYLRQHAVFLVAEESGVVVGDGIAQVRKHKTGLSGRIYSLAVGAGPRGRGVGRMLLEALVARLAERGARRVYLEVEEQNQGAVQLYEKCGFRRIGILPDYYGPGKQGAHMVREIAEVVKL